MRRLPIFVLISVIMVTLSCNGGEEDAARISELMEMPALWESRILVANPEMPELMTLAAMYDSYDATLAEAFRKDRFTADYIPEAICAFTLARYRDKPRIITLRIGDRVEVLDCIVNETDREVCLVRTIHGTYAWIYAFHLKGKDGYRMDRMR